MNAATVYQELCAKHDKHKPSRLETMLLKAGAENMARDDVERIICYALLSWEQLAALRDAQALPAQVIKMNPHEPANLLEHVMWTLAKNKDAAAYLVPRIRKWFNSRDALQIRLATKGKRPFESDYDIQAEVVASMPGITDVQVQKRRTRLEKAVKDTGRKTQKNV